ncbi:hypothetical protein TNCV_1424511 [Trichonephila clavipes]|nr:hypothetical protein TNCV_1424511 [Trichonephila clavipes]
MVEGKKCYGSLRNFEEGVRQRYIIWNPKLLINIDVSVKAEKVSKTADILDVYILPTPLKTSKNFLQWYLRTGFKQVHRRAELKNMAKNGL